MKNRNIICTAVLILLLLGSYNAHFTFAQSNTTQIKKDSTADTIVVNKTQTSKKDILPEKIKDIKEDTGFESLKDLLKFEKILWTLFVLLAGFFILKFVAKILQVISDKSVKRRIALKGTIPIVRLAGWFIIAYIIIGWILQPPFATVIAVSASLGIAVGLAAQDLLKNVFGGIMILFDRPFQVGDKIKVGEYYGEVLTIGLRSTRVVTNDDSVVSIPNSEIMNNSVSNTNYGEPNCQVVAEIYLPIHVDTIRVREIALEAAQVSKYIYLGKPVVVLFFNEVIERESYLKMRLKAYVMDIRYEFMFKSEMTEAVIRELIAEEIIKG